MRTTPIEREPAGRWWKGLGIAAYLLAATPVVAAEPAASHRTQARGHFDRGVALAKAERFGEALSEFELAYDMSPHFSVLYNIAQALTVLGRATEASAAFERYLREGGANIEPRRRAEVEAAIVRERDKTGTLELTIDTEGAEVAIDGKPVGRSPLTAPIRLDAGPHRVEAALDSGLTREIAVDIVPKQTASARLELRTSHSDLPAPVEVAPLSPPPERSRPKVASARVVRPARDPDRSTRSSIGYVIGAAGVALSAAAVGHYLWNRGRYEDWLSRNNDYYRDPTEPHREAANSLADSIQAASAVTVGLAIGAGVTLGTGAVLVVTGGTNAAAAPNGEQARGGFMALRGEF